MPPVRVVQNMAAQSVVEVDPGVFVYDFGQNFGGWTRLRARGPAGTRIVLRFAARADDQGRLDTINNMDVTQEDVYILQGGATVMRSGNPALDYTGFVTSTNIQLRSAVASHHRWSTWRRTVRRPILRCVTLQHHSLSKEL